MGRDRVSRGDFFAKFPRNKSLCLVMFSARHVGLLLFPSCHRPIRRRVVQGELTASTDPIAAEQRPDAKHPARRNTRSRAGALLATTALCGVKSQVGRWSAEG